MVKIENIARLLLNAKIPFEYSKESLFCRYHELIGFSFSASYHVQTGKLVIMNLSNDWEGFDVSELIYILKRYNN